MTGTHPWAAAARSFPLAGSGSGLLAVLAEDGLRALRQQGHEAVAAACAPGLAPRAVRFVDGAGWSAIECADEAGLRRLLEAAAPERPLATPLHREPGRGAQLELRIQPDLLCLRGHFPDLPLVPGAILLGWAAGFAAEQLGMTVAGADIPTAKFQRIVQPGHLLQLELRQESGQLQFEYRSAAGRHAGGRLRA